MITNRKLTDSSFAATEVEGLDDRPQISAQELKQRFDANVKDVMAPAFNAMIDDLGAVADGGSGADNIGCTPVGDGSANTVQGALEELNEALEGVSGLVLASAPEADTTVSGITAGFTAANNLAFGDVCYVDSNGKAALIDADAIATMTGNMMCADASISADASGNFLLFGFARNDAWNWTAGEKIYGSTTGTTGNTMTQTAPSGSNDVVQILGVATHADRIFFNPQLVQVEVL